MTELEGNLPLEQVDPDIYELLKKEKRRQIEGLELIASENFTSRAVLDALSSCLTNKYSEGLPGARYYGGNEIIDEVERLCIKRALETFHLKPEEWGVNVQPYSGSTANFAAFTGLLAPHERLMGLDLPSGGHLTHGYQTAKKKISSTSIYFESMPYRVSPSTGYIDYDRLEENAELFKPKLIISGASAYPRDWDYCRLRKIADKVGAYLLCDMAHISGLVAAGECANPFDYCDVVTTTTHKTLRGPRAGLIFFRRGNRPGSKEPYDLESRINSAVFPAVQGGPHENTIAAVAVALKEAQSESFKQYIRQVKANARTLGEELIKRGYDLVTGGTDNHLILWDLRRLDLTGSKLEKLLEAVSISANKNAVYGDVNAVSPGGLRLGTHSFYKHLNKGSPALTSRGLKEADFAKIAEFLDRAVKIALDIQSKTGKKLQDFLAAIPHRTDILSLKEEVQSFARKFPMPGYTDK